MTRLSIELTTANVMRPHVHGRHPKDLIVLHETVSADQPGTRDVDAIVNYLARIDYGIHGVVDAEGIIAWASGLGNAVFWHAGGVNERSIGIEQVSRVMLDAPTNTLRRALWTARTVELRRTAQLVCCAARAWSIPLRYSDGDHPGVTTHWSVSQHHAESLGHTDCWPVHLGGYYPALEVIALARQYQRAGLRF